MEYVFLRLAERTEEVSWARLDGTGRRLSAIGRGTLAEAAGSLRQARLIVLVPGPQVVTTKASVPVRSPSRLRQVLPYSLEEALAEDVERLLFAPGRELPGGGISVSVVARRQLDAWLERLRGENLEPDAVYAETDGVPDTPGTLTLIAERSLLYARRPEQPAFVFEDLGLEQTLTLLREAQQQDARESQHVLLYLADEARQRYEPEIEACRGKFHSFDVRLMEDGALPRFAATLLAAPGANLLQGPYARKSNWHALLRPWRVAAALALAWIGISVLSQAAGYVALRQQDRALTQAVEAACRQHFSATGSSGCRTEVERRLAVAGEPVATSGERFLATLSTVAEAGDSENLVTALSFRNGVMDIRLLAPSVPALDAFARRIAESDAFDVRIQSTNPGEEGVEGQVQIVRAAR